MSSARRHPHRLPLSDQHLTEAALGADPVTAGLNAVTVAMLLVMKIIDTVPPEQHAENWERLDRLLDRFAPG